MKKLHLLVCAFTCLWVQNNFAQNTDNTTRDKFTFGLKVGVNHSNVYDASGQDFNAQSKFGFAGGGFAGIPIGKFLGLQPELLLSQKGYQSSGTLLLSPYSDARTTTYLDIPLQLQIKPLEILTLLAGVQYSYLLHQRDVYTFGNTSVAQDLAFKTDNARTNLFGAVIGADLTLSHLVVSLKACWDLQNNVANGSSYTPRYKNVWIQATIGYRFYRAI